MPLKLVGGCEEKDILNKGCKLPVLFVRCNVKTGTCDKESQKVLNYLTTHELPAIEIVNLQTQEGLKLAKKYKIDIVPALVDLDGNIVEGADKIIDELKLYSEIEYK